MACWLQLLKLRILRIKLLQSPISNQVAQILRQLTDSQPIDDTELAALTVGAGN